MPASALDHTGTDRPATSQVLVAVHVGQVAPVVADGGVQRLALGRRKGRVLGQLFQGLDDRLGAPGEDVQQLLFDPGGTDWTVFRLAGGAEWLRPDLVQASAEADEARIEGATSSSPSR